MHINRLYKLKKYRINNISLTICLYRIIISYLQNLIYWTISTTSTSIVLACYHSNNSLIENNAFLKL